MFDLFALMLLRSRSRAFQKGTEHSASIFLHDYSVWSEKSGPKLAFMPRHFVIRVCS
jgi:hypothetical protein